MPTGGVDTFDRLTRGIMTLGMTAGFIFLAITGKLSSDVYTNIYGIVVTFWFVSRQNQQRAEDIVKAVKANGGGTPAPATDPPATTTTS
jgi:hypothetical protein